MAGFDNNDDEIISSINVTPLVDIMLVLLIIFMLVSTFVEKDAIEIELPHAATGSEIENKTVSILVSKDGNYFLAGAKMESFNELEQKIKIRRDKNPEIQVVIAADRKVYHGKVIEIIDMVRKLEIYKFAINVEYNEQKGK